MRKRTGIQLCYPFEERRLLESKFGWKWPVLVQPKLDGERMRALCSGNVRSVILLSSTEHIITSVPHIQEELNFLQTYQELDGELYTHGMDFDSIASIVSRTVNLHKNYLAINYYVFDLIDTTQPQITRTTILENLFANSQFTYIKLVPTYVCFNMQNIMYRYQQILDDGYEGIIVRHLQTPYVRKRSNMIMKFKPKKKDIYKIIAIMEGAGEHQGMVGKFICQGNDSTTFSVGAGEIKHNERKKIWQNREELVENWLEVRYQNITSKGVPRFGIAKQILITSSLKDNYQSIL